MNSTDFIEIFSETDDIYINEVRREAERKRPRIRVVRIAATVAALAVLTVGSALAARFAAPRPSGTTDPAVVRSDFVIENGELLGYLGDNSDVTVPDGVVSISSAAFRRSRDPSSIVRINLNSAVETIAADAFSGLDSLEEITVPEDNASFSFGDGILSASDGSIHFALESDGQIDGQAFIGTLEKMGRMKEYTERDVSFVFGDAVLVLHSEPIPQPDPETGAERSAWYTVRSVSAFGKTYVIEKGKYYEEGSLANGVIEVNALFELFLTDDAVVYEKKVSDFGLAVVISRDGVTEIYNSGASPWWGDGVTSETWYNDPVIWFGTDEEGRLTYTRTPRKYAFDQSLDLEIRYCVGRDELAREVGYVSFEGGVPVMTAERSYTAEELFDLDDLFVRWSRGLGSFDEELKTFGSIDDLIVYNRDLYEKAD